MGSNCTQTQNSHSGQSDHFRCLPEKGLLLLHGGLKNPNRFHAEACLSFSKLSQRFAMWGLSWLRYRKGRVHSCTCILTWEAAQPPTLHADGTVASGHIPTGYWTAHSHRNTMHKVVPCMCACVQARTGDFIASLSGFGKATEQTSTKI